MLRFGFFGRVGSRGLRVGFLCDRTRTPAAQSPVTKQCRHLHPTNARAFEAMALITCSQNECRLITALRKKEKKSSAMSFRFSLGGEACGRGPDIQISRKCLDFNLRKGGRRCGLHSARLVAVFYIAIVLFFPSWVSDLDMRILVLLSPKPRFIVLCTSSIQYFSLPLFQGFSRYMITISSFRSHMH